MNIESSGYNDGCTSIGLPLNCTEFTIYSMSLVNIYFLHLYHAIIAAHPLS